MTGHLLKALFVWILVPLLAGLVSCGPAFIGQETFNAQLRGPHVVIVKSADNPFYDQPVAAFMEQVETRTTVVTIAPDALESNVIDAVRALAPTLVFALGIEATRMVREHVDVPTVFAMVPGYQDLNLQPGERFFGITLESPPISDFTQFKLIVPTMRKVLVFYDPRASRRTVEAAQKDLVALGIELKAVAVENFDALKQAYRAHATGMDAIWLQIDPVVMNLQAFDFMARQTAEDGVPLVTSLSDKFAEAGALVSVSLDFASIGSQAANLAMTYLDQKEIPAEQRIQPPVGWRLTVNMTVAETLGHKVPEESLPYISRVIPLKNDP